MTPEPYLPDLTVREAIAAAMFRPPWGGATPAPITDLYPPEGVALLIADVLGIDPNMPVAELRRLTTHRSPG